MLSEASLASIFDKEMRAIGAVETCEGNGGRSDRPDFWIMLVDDVASRDQWYSCSVKGISLF